ncbi:MAG: type II toxin-antitoxin system HigB family toxin [Pedosphaera sp.]|nr:type II toxin-antitoxin system HigB family toxin [Pedosphaera sp.]
MRLIKPSTLKTWAEQFPKAREALAVWQRLIEQNDFAHLAALRRVFPHADPVAVRSGRTATVFNVCGNHYRLIAALHYNRQLCFALRFLTHAEYSRNRWKDEL